MGWGRRAAGCTVLVAAAAAGAGLVTAALPAAAVSTKNATVHVVYQGQGTVQQQLSGDPQANGTESVTWDVTASVPLAASDGVPYRYSTGASGTVVGTGTYTRGDVSCRGTLSITPSNGLDHVGGIEIDLDGPGSSKATLWAALPLPVNTSDIGSFTDANGAGCGSYSPILTIPGPAARGPKPVKVPIDLAQIAKTRAKTKVYTVGQSDTFQHQDAARNDITSKVEWTGTITLTLTR